MASLELSASKSRRLRSSATKKSLYDKAKEKEPLTTIMGQLAVLTANVDFIIYSLFSSQYHEELPRASSTLDTCVPEVFKSIKGQGSLESSCQTNIEGEEVVPVSMVEEFLRKNAEQTAELTVAKCQQKFDSQTETMLDKFEAKLQRLKDTITNLEKDLSRETARADALATELAKERPLLPEVPCSVAEKHDSSSQTSIKGQGSLESSCQTNIEGEEIVPVSMMEEFLRRNAEQTAELTVAKCQQKFDSQTGTMLDKFEAKLQCLKDTIMNLEKDLSRETARADALATELAKERSIHYAHAAKTSSPAVDREPWDPWLFFDKDELAPMSQTCHHWLLLVKENTPFLDFASAGLPATDG